jgi:hypothetical protein
MGQANLYIEAKLYLKGVKIGYSFQLPNENMSPVLMGNSILRPVILKNFI